MTKVTLICFRMGELLLFRVELLSQAPLLVINNDNSTLNNYLKKKTINILQYSELCSNFTAN
jgi:hypothetical protein